MSEKTTARPPNILFILADNLGYGELGVYGGGPLRGAPTPHIDGLAREGLRLTNMNMEPQCTPSRSSMLTGRHAIRSGTYAVPLGGVREGLTQWEVTLPKLLSDAGYATALYGKWHLGSEDGRLPNDQGFDEWYGIPRTTNETTWLTSPGYAPELVRPQHIMEGRKGEPSRELQVYDVQERRVIDAEITRRTVAFMEERARDGQAFYLFASLTQPHFPTLPHPRFAGTTGKGDWADMLAEMDHNVGEMLAAVDRLGLRDDTIVIFTSDNGAEFIKPWDGWAGPWRGAYFTALEGGLRVPFLLRWPGHVPPGLVSDEPVHGVDLFTTLAAVGGAALPQDRPIDGVDQSALFAGTSEKSGRDGFLVWVDNRLQAVKWRNFKVHFYQQDTMMSPPEKLPVPFIIDLYTNPREEEGKRAPGWVLEPMLKMVQAFEASLAQHPPIPMGTPDPYQPPQP